jgi:hypothetical protein
MSKIYPLRYKLPIKEPVFTLFLPRSAAMRLKNRFVRTLSGQFSPAKTKSKNTLNYKTILRIADFILKITYCTVNK